MPRRKTGSKNFAELVKQALSGRAAGAPIEVWFQML
jgi:hypothetical protein